MNMLVSLDTTTLESAQRLVREQSFAFNNLEKWSIAQSSLLLHQHGLVNLDGIEKGINTFNKDLINDTLSDAYRSLTTQLMSKLDTEQLDVGFDLTAMSFGEDSHAELIAAFVGGGEGIDIEPLSRLSDTDGEIVGQAIGGLKALFIDAPTAHSLEGFGSMYEEVIEVFENWLPKKLRKADIALIDAYYEKHREKFEELVEESGFYADFDSIVLDYYSKSAPVPKWYTKLDESPFSTNPQASLKKLSKAVERVQHPQARAFVEAAISTFTDYLAHFKNKKEWALFTESTECCRNFLETDEPLFELGFMLCWGGEGYWWDVVSNIHQMLMETGETPTYFLLTSFADNRAYFPLVYERFARGAVLLNKLAELSDEVRSERFKVA